MLPLTRERTVRSGKDTASTLPPATLKRHTTPLLRHTAIHALLPSSKRMYLRQAPSSSSVEAPRPLYGSPRSSTRSIRTGIKRVAGARREAEAGAGAGASTTIADVL